MKKSDVIGFGIVFLLCALMVATVFTFCYNPILGVAIGVAGWYGLKKLT